MFCVCRESAETDDGGGHSGRVAVLLNQSKVEEGEGLPGLTWVCVSGDLENWQIR